MLPLGNSCKHFAFFLSDMEYCFCFGDNKSHDQTEKRKRKEKKKKKKDNHDCHFSLDMRCLGV